tara:strand:- start:774 stop:1265 length:492 start_codon:yes stop_codon:yes gene_type:complete
MKPDKYYLDLEENSYYETIDKRSKDYREYKEWKATKESYKALKDNVEKQPKGLGDTIAKITKATGIDKVVKFIAGDDCGCDERQALWNEEFKYKTVKCLNEDDYKFLTEFVNRSSSKVDYHDKTRLIDIYNHVFSARENRGTHCTPCVVSIVKNLKRYLAAYQ